MGAAAQPAMHNSHPTRPQPTHQDELLLEAHLRQLAADALGAQLHHRHAAVVVLRLVGDDDLPWWMAGWWVHMGIQGETPGARCNYMSI